MPQSAQHSHQVVRKESNVTAGEVSDSDLRRAESVTETSDIAALTFNNDEGSK